MKIEDLQQHVLFNHYSISKKFTIEWHGKVRSEVVKGLDSLSSYGMGINTT